MPRRKLTDAAVRKLRVPEAGQVEHFDAGYPGLALRLSYGGGRAWTFHYRAHGRQRRMTLGRYPVMSLAEAREAWREARQQVDAGKDPIAERKEAKQAQPETVRGIADEFLRRYARPKLRTADEIKRTFELHVFPEIGDRPAASVTRSEIVRMLDRAQERGAKTRVNRVLAHVRKLFGWAVERGIIEVSPVTGIKAPAPERSRDRVLSDDEIVAFVRACDRLGNPFGSLFRLLLLTAQRRDEVAASSWSEFDLTEGVWSLPSERVKNKRAHVLPLSKQVVDVLEALPSYGSKGLLFPSDRPRSKSPGPRSVSGFGRAKERLDVQMLKELQILSEERGNDPESAELEPWRLHDLRRTAASGMARMSVPIHVVEKILNHVSGSLSGVAAVYNRHSYQNEMRSAVQGWANYIDDLTGEMEKKISLEGTQR